MPGLFPDRMENPVKTAVRKKYEGYAKRLQARLADAGVGGGFTDFLEFLKGLMPIIFAMPCFARSADEDDLAAAMDESYRKARRKRRDCCPRRVRKLMEKHGVTDPDEQDSTWLKLLEEGFVGHTETAKAMIAAEEDYLAEEE